MLLAIRIEPITKPARDLARAEVRQMILELERAGVTLYKIALMCHRQYNTVKNWKQSGRIEKCDGDMLAVMHAEYVSQDTALYNRNVVNSTPR